MLARHVLSLKNLPSKTRDKVLAVVVENFNVVIPRQWLRFHGSFELEIPWRI